MSRNRFKTDEQLLRGVVMMSFLISFCLQWFAILWPWNILNPNTQLSPSLTQKPCRSNAPLSSSRRLRFGADRSTSQRLPRRRRHSDIATTDGTGWTRYGLGTSTRPRRSIPNPPTASSISRITSTTRTRDELHRTTISIHSRRTLIAYSRGRVFFLVVMRCHVQRKSWFARPIS